MQFYHGLGLMLVGILSHVLGKSWFIRGAGALMIAGVLVFSGIVYANILGALEFLSPIVPSGGSMLMLSWLALLIGILTRAKAA
jgi:uncharacterized membrane protein YgdD (TMEM256/DUF423 family)